MDDEHDYKQHLMLNKLRTVEETPQSLSKVLETFQPMPMPDQVNLDRLFRASFAASFPKGRKCDVLFGWTIG
jgi:hypothetical protein